MTLYGSNERRELLEWLDAFLFSLAEMGEDYYLKAEYSVSEDGDGVFLSTTCVGEFDYADWLIPWDVLDIMSKTTFQEEPHHIIPHEEVIRYMISLA